MAEPDETSPPEEPSNATSDEPASEEAASEEAASEEAGDEHAGVEPEPPAGAGEAVDASWGPAFVPLLIAIAAPVLFFFVLPPLTRAGLWDPYELNVADLARRIAINLHGAANLALQGADNTLPHLDDLGRPQLPFTSIALGFKVFGLHEWAGRAPLALWGVLGVAATYGFVARLVDRRAGVFSALALTTMPLYFVQARTMLGDIVTMSAFAMAFGGLLVGVFDRDDDGGARTSGRLAWLAIAAGGLVAGFYSRGALLGVAAPALAIGLAYGVAVANGQRRFDALAHVVGAVALGLGASMAAIAVARMSQDRVPSLDPFIGAMVHPPGKYPTFDFTIGHVFNALAPWSAFAPFAFGRMFIAPRARTAPAFARESEARAALLIGTAVAFTAHGWMAARTDIVAFAAPAVIAAACGVALRDYERGAHPSVAVGVGTAVFLFLLHHELHQLPIKAYQAFAVVSGTFPEAFKEHALAIWTVVLLGFAAFAFLTFVERRVKRTPFEPEAYLRVLLALRDAWDGMLALAYFAMVAGASLAGLAVWIGARQHARWLPSLSSQMRGLVLNAWWVTAFVPIAAIFATYFWCDVWVWAFGRKRILTKGSWSRGFEPFEELAARLRAGRLGETVPKFILGKLVVTQDKLDDGIGPVALFLLAPLMYLQVPAVVFGILFKSGLKPAIAAALAIPSGVALFLVLGVVGDLVRGSRAAVMAAGGVVMGGILCVSYYPALANQLSPKQVFESYQHAHRSGEPLGLFGVGGRTAAYYAGGQPPIFHDAASAYDWLMAGEPAERRFLAVRKDELARMNKLYRERTSAGRNIPVIDGRSSQIILVASSHHEGEHDQNPLARIVLSEPPTPQRRIEANLEDQLLVLGYDVTDAKGRLVDRVSPGKEYHMKTYFKVLAPVRTEWEMFIHIDGNHRRHNGDHKVCQGKYPMSLWQKGDIVMDDYEFKLEPNFGPGAYTVYFGLFVGDTRLKVTKGPSDGQNRINGGRIRVQ